MCSNNISCTFDCVLAKSEKIIVVKCKLQISRQENVSILTKDHLSESVLPGFSPPQTVIITTLHNIETVFRTKGPIINSKRNTI